MQLGTATFSSEIFNASNKTTSSVPKSVEEEPHSATSPGIQNVEEADEEARNYDGNVQ